MRLNPGDNWNVQVKSQQEFSHFKLAVHGYGKPIYMCLRGEGPGDEVNPIDNWNIQVKGQQDSLSRKQRPFLSFRPWQCMAMGKDTETMQALQGQFKKTLNTHTVVKLTLTGMSSSVSLGKSSSSESASSSNKEPTISLAKPEMSEVDYRKSR